MYECNANYTLTSLEGHLQLDIVDKILIQRVPMGDGYVVKVVLTNGTYYYVSTTRGNQRRWKSLDTLAAHLESIKYPLEQLEV